MGVSSLQRKRQMTRTNATKATPRTMRLKRQWSLLVLAGLPLVLLHAVLLLERALHQETMDALALLRWSLALVLLFVLKQVAPRAQCKNSPTLGIAAILIFAMIHLPVAAPEPSLPLAATGLGLALSLAVFDRLCGPLTVAPLPSFVTQAMASAWGLSVSRDTLKDRAPPLRPLAFSS